MLSILEYVFQICCHRIPGRDEVETIHSYTDIIESCDDVARSLDRVRRPYTNTNLHTGIHRLRLTGDTDNINTE